MRIINASETGTLVLGFQGEDQRLEIRFPLVDEKTGRNITEEFPGGSFSISIMLPGDPAEHIVGSEDFRIEGNWLIWTVKEAYTVGFGEGKLQLNYAFGGMVKSRIWKTNVRKSINSGSGTVPSWSDWKTELLTAANAVQQAVESYDEMTAEAEDGDQTSAHIDRTGDHPVLQITIKNNGGGGGAVQSVNGKTGAVVLNANDVGALPSSTPIPPAVTVDSELSNTSTNPVHNKVIAGALSSQSETIVQLSGTVSGKYDKPSGGIPSTDMSQAVQTSLEKADTAIQEIVTLNNGGKVLTNGTKTALLNLFSHVAFTDENAQTYINALIDSWTPSGTLTSIDAVFTQTGIVEEGDNLDSLKQYLVVNGTYSYNGSTYTEEISEYTLSGTLAVGTSTITVTVGMLTDSFTVIVSQYNRYETKTKIIASGQQYISTNMSETDLDGCRFEYKLAPGSMSTNASGHLLSTEKNFIPYLKGSAHNSINASRNGGSGFDFEYNWTIGTDYTVVYDMADGSVSVNGTALERSVVSGSFEPSNTRKYIMFGYHGAGYEDYFYAGALYYMKIYSSGNVLIHHFVPALDKQTNKVGVYDEVTESFMSSSSSTEFTAE